MGYYGRLLLVRVGVGIGIGVNDDGEDDDDGDDDKIWVGGCINIYVCLKSFGKITWSCGPILRHKSRKDHMKELELLCL